MANPLQRAKLVLFISQPTRNSPSRRVFDTGESVTVVLVYNCYHMKEICTNYKEFVRRGRGSNMHPDSDVPNDRFGFDFRTGKGSRFRDHQRRRAVCPTGKLGWKSKHTCPEFDQRNPMRMAGEWPTTALRPASTREYEIADVVNPSGGVDRSWIAWSCDEFPPATWVEGGAGEDKATPGTTRCAAIRCGGKGFGVKAEQDCK